MEAMSFGIPVIATNVGGTSEIVDEENGKLFSANPSIEEIGSAIRRFMHYSAEEIDYKQQSALKTFQTKFNAEINFKAFIETILAH